MKHYLLLKKIQVENANAISGVTWGFPSPTQFLGFTHALSRKLQARFGEQTSLGGTGIICHTHQVQSYQPNGFEHVFALTRNPLTKEGKTAPFNAEGRMRMTVSLLIECHFDVRNLPLGDELPEQRMQYFQHLAHDLIVTQRLAGGSIIHIEQVRWWSVDTDTDAGQRDFRRQMLRLIPGFFLLDRANLLAEHHRHRLQQNPDAELLDSWLDFVALCYEPQAIDLSEDQQPLVGETKAEWKRKSKPATGYLVPLASGYQAISDLYEPGAVARARDNGVPFRFVESAYSIGEWRSPHRIKSPDDCLWQYHYTGDAYLCVIPSMQEESVSVESAEDDADASKRFVTDFDF
jgi:CRISPR-associated protein Csy2